MQKNEDLEKLVKQVTNETKKNENSAETKLLNYIKNIRVFNYVVQGFEDLQSVLLPAFQRMAHVRGNSGGFCDIIKVSNVTNLFKNIISKKNDKNCFPEDCTAWEADILETFENYLDAKNRLIKLEKNIENCLDETKISVNQLVNETKTIDLTKIEKALGQKNKKLPNSMKKLYLAHVEKIKNKIDEVVNNAENLANAIQNKKREELQLTQPIQKKENGLSNLPSAAEVLIIADEKRASKLVLEQYTLLKPFERLFDKN